MSSSSFTIEDLQKSSDHATGYQWDAKEVPQAIAYKGLAAMGPTGSINANVEDMSRYLRMYLARGEFEGKRVLNASDIVEMTNPQMVMADARTFDELSSPQYGMGFFLTHYRGERLVHHGGNMPGASSMLSFLPQRNIGVFTTTNLSGSQLPTIVTYAIYDRLLKLKPTGWSERFWERKEKGKASEESAKKQNLTPRKMGTKPAHTLDEYVGEFQHPGYSVMSITRDGEDLRATYNGLTSVVKHFHFDVFEAPEDKLNDLSQIKVAFQTDITGEVNSIQTALESGLKPIEFSRLPDAIFKDANFLKTFTGEYELGANKVSIALRQDNMLTLSIPGQTTKELTGVRGKRFALRGLDGYTIEFVADKTGAITQAAFYQPNGNFVATRK
jgi:hypothetical protein